MGLHVIVLAAGKGQRMVSDLPKVLHLLGGKPLLEHVINTAQQLTPQAIHIVYGNGGATVFEVLKHLPVNWVEQKQLLGTGHAVLQALPNCSEDDQVLILYGDVPLISVESLQLLLQETPKSGLGLIVAELPDPTGFGRIVRNDSQNIVAIVEHRDADSHQLKIKEINTGIITTKASNLKKWLPQLTKTNKQNEYYLTDIVAFAAQEGLPINGTLVYSSEEIQGVNDRFQLATIERYYQRRLAKSFMYAGVAIADPSRIDFRGVASIAPDVFLDINVILEGRVSIGKNSRIGPFVFLKDVEIGENVEIFAHSIIEGASIAEDCQIGPFARIRPGTMIAAKAKVGNFVELKKTFLGHQSKAPHLSYLGDAIIGNNVNIGAGTITCNYDGKTKHQTQINDGASIGAHTSLVAPVVIGKNATVGAGSTITEDTLRNH